MENKDAPAMPLPLTTVNDGVVDTAQYDNTNAGLTKREYFAAMALQGLSHAAYNRGFKDLSKEAVELADLIIDALEE